MPLPHTNLRVKIDKTKLRYAALAALEDVGDKGLGQWEEWTGKGYHVRRRLTADEEKVVGPAVDVRGTGEALRRIQLAQKELPMLPSHFFTDEL